VHLTQNKRRKQEIPEESVKDKPEKPLGITKTEENESPNDPALMSRGPYSSVHGRSMLMRAYGGSIGFALSTCSPKGGAPIARERMRDCVLPEGAPSWAAVILPNNR
jgi:hypothetical protein